MIKTNAPVVFLHIPKTGGQTVRRLLLRRFGRNAYYQLGPYRPDAQRPKSVTTIESIAEYCALSLAERNNILFCGGHIQFAVKSLLPENARFFTILREPVQRLISMYFHARRKKRHSLVLDVQKLSLLDFARSDITRQLDNDQTRRIAGVSEPGLADGMSEDEMLERAKLNLERYFPVVGTTERMDETLLLFRHVFRLTKIPFYVAVNKGANKTREVEEEVTRTLLERNQLDAKLFEYAKLRLDSDLRLMGPIFPLRLRAYKVANRVYSAWRQLASSRERRLFLERKASQVRP